MSGNERRTWGNCNKDVIEDTQEREEKIQLSVGAEAVAVAWHRIHMQHQPWSPSTASHSENWNSTWIGDIHKIFLFLMIWQVTRFFSPSLTMMRMLLQLGNLENFLVTHPYKKLLVRFLQHDNCFNAQELCFVQSYPFAPPAFTNNNKSVWFSTQIQTRKFPNIMKNPHRNECSIFILSQHSLIIPNAVM